METGKIKKTSSRCRRPPQGSACGGAAAGCPNFLPSYMAAGRFGLPGARWCKIVQMEAKASDPVGFGRFLLENEMIFANKGEWTE